MPALAARLLFLAVLLPFSLPALALDDTPQNREAQAERYLAAVPPKSQIADTVAGIAETLPPEQQEQFKALMLKYFDIDKVSVAIRQAMVKTFTADELKALADFYGSQVAKSAVGKMDAYRAEVLPATEQELQAAIAKVQAELHPQGAGDAKPAEEPKK
ncbi:DUF2059 domain-containing protein [Rhodomicrobium lacus]|jgi:hypothetical protein|uniref:DUF2059 domain-containing protein n=1 Tax=Rhodomicrobium lacus TaxID=2498452 RepID=UPI000F8F5205|nr:DUF2059 domain-containing protein [Rhodomicrobium lacus]WKW52393.1 DUF2059 domain-containing protein [Rhodomicrobium lacus]